LHPYESEAAQFLIFLPLVTYDEDGELEGRLAQSWEHSPDYREWTYHLRPNLRWHDGVPITAHDIKFSLELLTHPDVLEFSPDDFESITVLDDLTFRIRTSALIYPGWDHVTVFFPKHLLEKLDPRQIAQWEFWTNPVGNGPYRFVRYLPQTMMEFEANPDYYRGKPKIERVVLKSIGRAGLTELLSENVDVAHYAEAPETYKLAADPRFRVYYHFLEGAGLGIYWQNDHPFFRETNVRRALTLAINRRELLQVLNFPEDLPIVDGVYTGRQYRRDQLPEALPYDPEQAKRLLEAAGWRDDNGDGVRERDGEEAHFTALVRDFARKTGVYVQDQLRRVGVHMDVQTMDAQQVMARVREGEFEAALTFIGTYPALFESLRFGKGPPIGYKNARVVQLIDSFSVTRDPNERDRICLELTEIFRADVPVTWLFPSIRTLFVHRRIQGLSSPWRADPARHMDELWIEEKK
jgi:peptide/nickel transport system substrate-binding protein